MQFRLAALAATLWLGGTGSVVGPLPSRAADSSWVARSALYEVFVRDFSPSGNLQGVTAGLSRIQASGANVVWLMPIFPVGVKNRKDPLGSPYSVRNYREVNPDFGTAADFRALVRAVHGRGMRIILDWVPNHTAWDHPWIEQHPDYYVHNEKGEISVPRDDKGKLTDWTDVAQLDYGNPALRREMIDAMRFWLDLGIDGFRVDVAGFVADSFWREAIPTLRLGRKPILLLAEWGDLKMHRLGFDLTYGWDSYARLKAVWKGGPASTFVQKELEDLAAMPANGARLRFTTNHDETAWDNPPVVLFGGSEGARAAFAAMTLLPGRPLLYNGQEVESYQKLGLFQREAIKWNEPEGPGARAYYRQILELAAKEEAFRTGPLGALQTSAPDDLIAYRRGDVAVVVNVRDRQVRAELVGFSTDRSRDLLSGAVQKGATVALPPYGVAVLRRNNSRVLEQKPEEL